MTEFRLNAFFRLMREQNASDLYVTANAQVKLRTEGRMRSVGRDPIAAADIESAAVALPSTNAALRALLSAHSTERFCSAFTISAILWVAFIAPYIIKS